MDVRNQIARFVADGWHYQNYTFSCRQAYLWGMLIALPFVALVGGAYRIFLLNRAVLLNHTGLILLVVIVVSLPLHELFHGLGWKVAGRLENYEIKYLFKHGMPMCSCLAVLSTKAYLTGVLLPFLMLGGGSIVFLVAYPGTISVLAAVVNLLLPGADLLIAWKILRSGAAKIANQPEQVGFIGLYFPQSKREAYCNSQRRIY